MNHAPPLIRYWRTALCWAGAYGALLVGLYALPVAIGMRGGDAPAILWSLPGGVSAVLVLAMFAAGAAYREADKDRLKVALLATALALIVLDAFVHPILEYEGMLISGDPAQMAPFGPRVPHALMAHWAHVTANPPAEYGFMGPFSWPPNYILWMFLTPLMYAALAWLNGLAGWMWANRLHPKGSARPTYYRGRLGVVGVVNAIVIVGALKWGRLQVLASTEESAVEVASIVLVGFFLLNLLVGHALGLIAGEPQVEEPDEQRWRVNQIIPGIAMRGAWITRMGLHGPAMVHRQLDEEEALIVFTSYRDQLQALDAPSRDGERRSRAPRRRRSRESA